MPASASVSWIMAVTLSLVIRSLDGENYLLPPTHGKPMLFLRIGGVGDIYHRLRIRLLG